MSATGAMQDFPDRAERLDEAAFYTAMGHTPESLSDPLVLGHIAAGLKWAMGRR